MRNVSSNTIVHTHTILQMFLPVNWRNHMWDLGDEETRDEIEVFSDVLNIWVGQNVQEIKYFPSSRVSSSPKSHSFISFL